MCEELKLLFEALKFVLLQNNSPLSERMPKLRDDSFKLCCRDKVVGNIIFSL